MLTKPKTFGFQSFTDFTITGRGLHYCHSQRRTKGWANRAAARDVKTSLE